MEIDKKSSALTKFRVGWIGRWSESETLPTVLPKSKTERLALQAKSANLDAKAIMG